MRVDIEDWQDMYSKCEGCGQNVSYGFSVKIDLRSLVCKDCLKELRDRIVIALLTSRIDTGS